MKSSFLGNSIWEFIKAEEADLFTLFTRPKSECLKVRRGNGTEYLLNCQWILVNSEFSVILSHFGALFGILKTKNEIKRKRNSTETKSDSNIAKIWINFLRRLAVCSCSLKTITEWHEKEKIETRHEMTQLIKSQR